MSKPWEKYGRLDAEKENKKKSTKELEAEYRKQIASEEGTLSSMLIGAGKFTHDLVEGTKELFQGDDYKGSQFDAGAGYDALKEENPIATTSGEIIGEIAAMAVPGGAATKLAKLSKLGKAAPLVGDMVGGLAVSGLKKPGEGETRAGNMQSDALATILGTVGGKALGKVVHGGKKVEGAEELIDRGVDLNVGHATDTWTGRQLDKALRLIPGGGMNQLDNNVEKAWHNDIIKGAALNPKAVTESGRKGIEQVNRQFKKAYQEVWSKVDDSHLDGRGASKQLWKMLKDPKLNKDEMTFVKNLRKEVLRNVKLARKAPASELGEHYNSIDQHVNAAIIKAQQQGNEYLADSLQDVLGTVRAKLPNEVKEQLANIDQKFPEYLTLKRAGSQAAATIGNFNPAQAINASKQTGGVEQYIGGKGPLQEIIEQGQRTVGRKESGESMVGSFVKGLPGPGAEALNKTFVKPFLGSSPTQKLLRKVDKARKGGDTFATGGIDEIIRAGRLGAAVNDGDMPAAFPDKDEFDEYINKLIEQLGL